MLYSEVLHYLRGLDYANASSVIQLMQLLCEVWKKIAFLASFGIKTIIPGIDLGVFILFILFLKDFELIIKSRLNNDLRLI